MLYSVFDWEKSLIMRMDINELAARIAAFNIRENSCLETAKCFAIMARTELARKTKLYNGSGCNLRKGSDICTKPGHCLEFGIPNIYTPYDKMPQSIRQATEETKNKIITFGGKPIKPYFHLRCGGTTENSENVLGNKITYLRKVYCSYCADIEDEEKDKYFTLEELEQLLNIKIVKPKDEYSSFNGIFEKIEVDEDGRIRSVKIGGKNFKGTEIADKLYLNSTRFNYMPVKFLITCIGKGHGLGLCYSGSEEMAKAGMKYEEILNYYYTGIDIEEMRRPDRPLNGQIVVLDAASGRGDKNESKSMTGFAEGPVNLSIVLELKELLKENGAVVYLTRETEHNVILLKRVELTNEKKPDFFISIGQNTFQNDTASGTEIYHYREDKAGKKLSEYIMEEVTKELNCNDRGVREAEFYLLREVRCSATFIELLYITNPVDEGKLKSPLMHKKAARAIYRAVIRYYGE